MASFSPLANGFEATVTGALVAALATAGAIRKAAAHDDEEDEVDTAGDAMRPSSLGDVIARSVLLLTPRKICNALPPTLLEADPLATSRDNSSSAHATMALH